MTLRESIDTVRRREAKKADARQEVCDTAGCMTLALTPPAQAMQAATKHITPFSQAIKDAGLGPLQRTPFVGTMQVNIGKLCNLTCRHCHVESGPSKRRENMDEQTVQRCLTLLAASPSIHTVDITGGAPELNPHFRTLVRGARALGKTVIDRCNLVVMFERDQEDLPAFLAEHQVHVVASLPCYSEENTDGQRGKHVHMDSIEALRRLNALGYGRDPALRLDLVYNPTGPSLPPSQATLDEAYRDELRTRYDVVYDGLFTIANMPIKRFADDLFRDGRLAEYMSLLSNAFNTATVDKLMCRETINVQWDGTLYDCDFNAALEMDLKDGKTTVWTIDSFDDLADRPIATGRHCYGCTAGAGSSCGGSLAAE